MRRSIRAFLVLLLLPLIAACGQVSSGNTSAEDLSQRPINVVATIGMIADTARVIGGERVNVTALMGPGVDPHLYRASADDLNTLEQADIIFYGGLELEGRMTDVLVRLASRTPTIAISEQIPTELLLQPAEYEGKYDPHVWFDPTLWEYAARTIGQQLAELDPASAALYQGNADAYVAELRALDAYAREQIARIPEAARVLITAHDAFGYFGLKMGKEK
jgi:manganese/zinc/iron transport system substrate-binding protein